MSAEPEAREPYYVRAVERALQVIQAFDAEHPSQTLSEVAAATRLNRATARRLLLTLQDLGFVSSQGRQFTLTPHVLQLGYAYLSGMSLVEIARPHLQSIARELGETASLTVLDGDEIVYLDLATSSRLSSIQINVGTRFKAHTTSMGRVLLAGLPQEQIEAYLKRLEHDRRLERTVRPIDELRSEIAQTAERGWATVDQELEEGLRGVAAPVRDRRGDVIAAVNVSAHAARKTIADLAELYVPPILETVRRIEAGLVGYQHRRS
ncbi:IclR family transcriptional regulator domain-containing protein [Leifsonia sp. Root112D2]|jgi:IclR family pca regulon transcriptional regulator|uniref:IclR family transcriptional regulator domain-containing protein n=1 Tax=Leifsonia sp. Root112D2 TaxID=1736426 RepID=UPI0006F84ABB|nr:IclR family transcriptional regulator C-terminal domain-containing protein [Leifsonia sp. Root112D2]KQV06781.1 IclR family transcriptional regulator [Leifsonia sp. Root112D2]